MEFHVAVTPAGRLRASGEADDGASGLASDVELELAFERSSADGLLELAKSGWDGELSAELSFWREFSRAFFQQVCHLGEADAETWDNIPEPSEAEWEQMAANAPPMAGLEYLTAARLRVLWRELCDLASAKAKEHREGRGAWLREVHPQMRMLGRVTFHLAENKRDPARPFAFLATFAHRLGAQARLQHLPLAEALKSYAGAKDRAKLAALLEPVKRAAERSELIRELLDSKALFAPQAWSIKQAHRFLTESLKIEESGVVVRLPNWWSSRTPPRPRVSVSIGQKPGGSLALGEMLDFQVDLALDGEPLTSAERKQLMAATEGLVFLRGKWVEADREQLQQALDHWKSLEGDQGIGFIEGMRLLAGANLGAKEDSASDAAIADWSRVTAGDWLRQTLDRLRRPESIDACQPGRDLQATLRPYQIDGVRWLWFMTELGVGGCLADDMGLGKTIQVIDLLLMRKRQRAEADATARPNLLVVPASLIGNWRNELERFGPTLKILYAHRSECSAEEMAVLADHPEKTLAGCDLLITTYGLARRQSWLESVDWSLVVIDEAQAIKNPGSTQTRAVKKLRAACRIALTGTPVENHLGDLWSLFDFCCPGLLGSAGQFKKYVKQLNLQQNVQAYGALRRLVRPYILRRLKTDPKIVPDLPEKTEMRTDCGLSKKQAVLYEKTVYDVSKRLKDSDGIARRGLVLSLLMQLKQICNHPAQYLASSSAFREEESGKFARLRLLCEPIAERQEKALVFTQFQAMTEPLAEFLANVFGRPGLVLHGGTPVGKRSELVRQFQDEAGPPFFVISLKAGGSGLNLTAANHVVHFDRWWNPAVENQATDRAFRIGQKRNVLVHKFVCRGTVEERIDAMIASKKAIADLMLNGDGETLLTEMSDDELMRFVALDIGRATGDE